MSNEEADRTSIATPIPTFRELVMALFRQRKVFLGVAGIVCLGTILYLFTGSRYQAQMQLLVRPGRADAPISAQENAPLDLTRLTIPEEELNSEVELLRGDEVLRKAAEESGLGGRDWLHFLRIGEGNNERVERAARRLGKKLDVQTVKKTNLIAVSYASGDPALAAKVLQSVANAYLEKHAAVRRPGGEAGFFAKQNADSRQELEDAKGKLLEFSAAHAVVAAPQERDLAIQRISELDATYRQARIELAETRQRMWELQKQVSALPERTVTVTRTADNPELLKALNSSLLDLQLKKTQLLTKFEPNHPLVLEVEQQIVQAEGAIANQKVSPIRDETTDKNPQYEWAAGELQKAEVQWKGLQARAVATQLQEATYRKLASRLGDDAITQNDLLSREKAAEENYLLYVKKEEQARMADSLDQRGIVNVAIAERPVVPSLPAWSTFAVLAAGLAIAGTAGAGAAFTSDYLDPTFRTTDDVLLFLNTPVLASLPRGMRGRIA
jgi:uncharacterized protein involved in exopolysaccharide biosynthesis